MTKFILHGGETKELNQDNDDFYRKIVVGFKNNINILFIPFAKEQYKWQESYERNKERILNLNKNKKILFELGNPEILEKQIKNADVVYINGGNSFRLFKSFSSIKNFSSLIKNKVIVGTSAGAYVLCKYFYENDDDKLGRGLGILNLKCFCHFDETKLKLVEKLKNYSKKDLEILALPEFKHQIIYK